MATAVARPVSGQRPKLIATRIPSLPTRKPDIGKACVPVSGPPLACLVVSGVAQHVVLAVETDAAPPSLARVPSAAVQMRGLLRVPVCSRVSRAAVLIERHAAALLARAIHGGRALVGATPILGPMLVVVMAAPEPSPVLDRLAVELLKIGH